MLTLPLFESNLLSKEDAGRAGLGVLKQRLPLIPVRKPEAGEQYRFHFDMSKCIGCKCCVVACNQQNGNPPDVLWRRVGELEGGRYPYTQRHYLSMGCNHCLEPTCLPACPVVAYTKDPQTGVVIHDAEACIGCQYCTWNCSYGVPVFNPERGVVGKCDLCHNRLADDMVPACAEACPEEAIRIEIVDVQQWRQDYRAANAPGLPSADDSLSTTRVTLPANLLPDTGRVDTQQLKPEHPHYPLILMLVLTQMSVGAFASLAVLQRADGGGRNEIAATISLLLAGISLIASTFHLGRPAFAWRALRALKTSWLSREVLLLSLFALVASVYACSEWSADADLSIFHRGAHDGLGALTALAGFAGIFCSARIYIVPARPAWNSRFTVADFFATAFVLGPLFVRPFGFAADHGLAIAAASGAILQLAVQGTRLIWLFADSTFELKGSALLYLRHFQNFAIARMLLLAFAALLAWAERGETAAIGALTAALAAELIGRWLFFVTVVPKNIGAAFVLPGGRA